MTYIESLLTPNPNEFVNNINTIKNINLWFKTNLLPLNNDKTNFTHFINKNSSWTYENAGYDNKLISKTSTLKFVGQ
jgi:hypothetical protein